MVLLRYQEPGGKRGIHRVSDMQNLNQYELLPLKLYSAFQRQLVATGKAKGTPQQWIGTILNLQKRCQRVRDQVVELLHCMNP